MTVVDLVRSYDTSIIVRRWVGCWVDFIALFALFLVPDAISKQFYQNTMGVWIGLAVAYFPLTETLWGQSLGKLLTGTVVVDEDGGKPGFIKSLIRTLLRLVEVNPFVAGGVPAGLVASISKTKQRLGDMAAGTYVIRREHLPLIGAGAVAGARYLPKPRAPIAVAAGYLGLCSVILLPAPFALGTGLLALKRLKERPDLGGRAGAVFGVVMGSIGTVILLVGIVSSVKGD